MLHFSLTTTGTLATLTFIIQCYLLRKIFLNMLESCYFMVAVTCMIVTAQNS